jgi:hypothetical protein
MGKTCTARRRGKKERRGEVDGRSESVKSVTIHLLQIRHEFKVETHQPKSENGREKERKTRNREKTREREKERDMTK